MASEGDHNAWPAEIFSFIHNTAAMHLEVVLLESNVVVAWFDYELRASSNEVATATAEVIGALFVVRFIHQHHVTIASSHCELPYSNTKLQLRAWRLESHTKNSDLRHHVWICLEGLHLYACHKLVVASTIDSGFSLDYIKPASKRQTKTKVLALWTWTSRPIKIPR